MWAHLRDEPPTVSAERPDLPAAIDAVIARAMSKVPDERYASCVEMVAVAAAALASAAPATGEREPDAAPAADTDEPPTRAAADHPACIREALEDAQLWPNLRPRWRT
jgi:serine/threonine-protein kinase